MAASSRRSHLESASMKPAGDHSSTIRCWASNMPTRLYLPREITRPEREQEGREGERESAATAAAAAPSQLLADVIETMIESRGRQATTVPRCRRGLLG
jgi:hypothetical protein